MLDLTKCEKVVNRSARQLCDDIFYSGSAEILINGLIVAPRHREPSLRVTTFW